MFAALLQHKNDLGCRVVASLLLSLSVGCAQLQYPDLFNPGTMREQQLRAVIRDPYPDPNAGPEVLGARPREYDQPLPEPVKNRPNFYAAPPRRW